MKLIGRFRKVVSAVSGGVDSSVAAYLLKKRGFDVTGVYMRNWDKVESDGTCSSDRDADDAEYVCKKLGIRFLEVNFVKEYWNSVFTDFIRDYECGFTPNPDVLCNKNIKFGAFYNYAVNELGANAIATGHYALTSSGEAFEKFDPVSGVHLLMSRDKKKDQTFFLSQVPQEPLQKTLFPLGNLLKIQVKQLATDIGLEFLAKKKESMGICFVGASDFQSFIEDYVQPKNGKFIDLETGNVVGEHKGVHLWTIGQRCHLRDQHYPYYIVSKELHSGNIIVAPGGHHPSLYSRTLVTGPPHWIHSKPSTEMNNFLCLFRFQHKNPLTECYVTETDNGLHVVLEHPLRALTPGQFSVFYKDNVCLGSAQIISVGSSVYRPDLMRRKT